MLALWQMVENDPELTFALCATAPVEEPTADIRAAPPSLPMPPPCSAFSPTAASRPAASHRTGARPPMRHNRRDFLRDRDVMGQPDPKYVFDQRLQC